MPGPTEMIAHPFPSPVLQLARGGRLGDPVRAFRPPPARRLLAVLLRRARPRPVYLFEGGLVRPPDEVYGWAELSSVVVAGVRPRRRGRTRWRITIATAAGRTARLDGELTDAERLGEVIVAEVARRVVPSYVTTIESGGAVELGPFTVSAKGVEKDAELVPWPAVREVGMSNGVVYVRRVNRVTAIAATAARVPNAAAFIALCRHLGVPVAET
jgi:hypothetical protein